MEVISWILVSIGLTGTIFNIKRKRVCFYIWSVSNFCLCIFNFIMGIPAQGVLFGIYFCLAIWGIYAWRRE